MAVLARLDNDETQDDASRDNEDGQQRTVPDLVGDGERLVHERDHDPQQDHEDPEDRRVRSAENQFRRLHMDLGCRDHAQDEQGQDKQLQGQEPVVGLGHELTFLDVARHHVHERRRNGQSGHQEEDPDDDRDGQEPTESEKDHDESESDDSDDKEDDDKDEKDESDDKDED